MQQYIWFDGKFLKFEDVKLHILTHSFQYGSGIFEGIRSHKTDTGKGPAIFRLKEHVDRFFNSAKIYNMKLPFDKKTVTEAIVGTVRKNKLEEAYIRPNGFYNDQRIGVDVVGKKVSVSVAAIDFGNYFEKPGLSCKISSWKRINSDIIPPAAKASGNYLNSILASTEAKLTGADEAIMLSTEGDVAEGPGENIFIVKDGALVTPSKESDILPGITRDSIIKVSESIGLTVEERKIHREELYTADEAFFTGTAAKVTPIVKIDSRSVGTGGPGPITKMLAEKYDDIVRGKNPEYADWLTFVN